MKVGGISNAVENFTTNIINKLGDNFISKTNIHKMNSHGRFPNDKENFEKKMLLQRVFDPDLCLSKLLKSENYEDFRERIFTVFGCKHFNIFSTKDLKIVDDEKSYEIFKKYGTNSEKLLEYLKDNSMFLEPIVGNYSYNGLSVSNEGFWGCDRNSYDYRGTKSFFGFSNDNKAYLKYLNSCSDLYKKLLKANISNDDFEKYSKDSKYRGIKAQMGYPFLDDNSNLDDFIEKGKCYEIENSDQRHPIIPVIINHPDIPDLRWCHSSYAFIPSKNGMNIIKMKS